MHFFQQRKTQEFIKEREWEEQQNNNARILILKQLEMDKLKKYKKNKFLELNSKKFYLSGKN